jgi:hypothetical protein
LPPSAGGAGRANGPDGLDGRGAPGGRGARSRASVTVRLRPWTLRSCRPAIACARASGVSISTNPKPRERPVSRSTITWALRTGPKPWKSSRRSTSLKLNGRLPT